MEHFAHPAAATRGLADPRTAVVVARGLVGAVGLGLAVRRLAAGRGSGWYFVVLGGRQVVQALLDARPGPDGDRPGLPPWVDEVVDVAHVATMLGALPVARGHRAFALRGAASAAAWVLLDRWSDRRRAVTPTRTRRRSARRARAARRPRTTWTRRR